MKQSATRLGLAAAALLLAAGSAAPAWALPSVTDPDAAVACQAFQPNGAGGWMATAPTTLDYNNGTALNISPGETFAPSQIIGGVEVVTTLERHCGNL
ncbi:MAG TPA: hypothetical protein VME41_12575 [Stellaceae bacterium]|nr:hypothetical protein [Stellaceae bacterium]